MIKPPFYPIIYIRGYAGSQAEVEDTVATPYMGFNLGSTKLRQLWDREIVKYIFESPLIRLMKDHAYTDVFKRGGENRTNGVASQNGPVFVDRSTRLVGLFADEYADDLGQ